MPGIDEEFAQGVEQEASTLAMRFMFSLPRRAHAPREKPERGRIQAETLEETGASAPQAPVPNRTFTLDFKTVPWDPKAAIIADNLEKLGVPFKLEITKTAENKKSGLAEITIDAADAKQVKRLIDGMASSGRVQGFTRERIANYHELEYTAKYGVAPSSAGEERILRSMPLPTEDLHRVTCALQELEIEHEIVESPDGDAFTVIVAESEVRERGITPKRIEEAVNAVKPYEVKAGLQMSYEQSTKARESRNANSQRIERETARKRSGNPQAAHDATVSRDVIRARKSAEAQKRAAGETVRRRAIGR